MQTWGCRLSDALGLGKQWVPGAESGDKVGMDVWGFRREERLWTYLKAHGQLGDWLIRQRW